MAQRSAGAATRLATDGPSPGSLSPGSAAARRNWRAWLLLASTLALVRAISAHAQCPDFGDDDEGLATTSEDCDERLASDASILPPQRASWGTDFFPDQGNVLRAVKQGPDVLLSFSGAPAPEWRLYRDTDKTMLGASALKPDARTTSFPDAGAAAGPPSLYFYALDGLCTIDMDCGDLEYCTPAKSCALLPTPGAVACPGDSTTITSACNQQPDSSALESCAGAAGPPACPYCRDNSCYWPMSWTGPPCASSGDCHAGDRCSAGLCVVDTTSGQDPCPKTVSIQDLIDGRYGAGKEVCVQDVVVKLVSETDGDDHVRIGNVTYPNQTFTGFITEPTPQYLSQTGLLVPVAGQIVRCHGMVRWDSGHGWWELHTVDWYGP